MLFLGASVRLFRRLKTLSFEWTALFGIMNLPSPLALWKKISWAFFLDPKRSTPMTSSSLTVGRGSEEDGDLDH